MTTRGFAGSTQIDSTRRLERSRTYSMGPPYRIVTHHGFQANAAIDRGNNAIDDSSICHSPDRSTINNSIFAVFLVF